MDKECDYCGDPAVYDAKMISGPWAYVCEWHFQANANGAPGTFTTLARIGTPGRAPYSD